MLNTREEIEAWLLSQEIYNFKISADLIVDVEDDVNLHNKELTHIPVQFGRIKGYFDCSNNEIKSLDGCPKVVEHDFYCTDNYLSSLENGPKSVGGRYDCSRNKLTSLEGAPNKVAGYFKCENNKLATLRGAPHEIGTVFSCYGNPIKELGDIHIVLGDAFWCPPISEFRDSKKSEDNDGDYLVMSKVFNAKMTELKRIREEKALFESSIAKVLDSPPLGAPTKYASEPQPQQRAKPKFKL